MARNNFNIIEEMRDFYEENPGVISERILRDASIYDYYYRRRGTVRYSKIIINAAKKYQLSCNTIKCIISNIKKKEQMLCQENCKDEAQPNGTR